MSEHGWKDGWTGLRRHLMEERLTEFRSCVKVEVVVPEVSVIMSFMVSVDVKQY